MFKLLLIARLQLLDVPSKLFLQVFSPGPALCIFYLVETIFEYIAAAFKKIGIYSQLAKEPAD